MMKLKLITAFLLVACSLMAQDVTNVPTVLIFRTNIVTTKDGKTNYVDALTTFTGLTNEALWIAQSNLYYRGQVFDGFNLTNLPLGSAAYSNFSAFVQVEVDPIWAAASNLYFRGQTFNGTALTNLNIAGSGGVTGVVAQTGIAASISGGNITISNSAAASAGGGSTVTNVSYDVATNLSASTSNTVSLVTDSAGRGLFFKGTGYGILHSYGSITSTNGWFNLGKSPYNNTWQSTLFTNDTLFLYTGTTAGYMWWTNAPPPPWTFTAHLKAINAVDVNGNGRGPGLIIGNTNENKYITWGHGGKTLRIEATRWTNNTSSSIPAFFNAGIGMGNDVLSLRIVHSGTALSYRLSQNAGLTWVQPYSDSATVWMNNPTNDMLGIWFNGANSSTTGEIQVISMQISTP